jgi:hypothetical protein
MKPEELQLILEEGEGYKIEFKESLSALTKKWSPLLMPLAEEFFGHC